MIATPAMISSPDHLTLNDLRVGHEGVPGRHAARRTVPSERTRPAVAAAESSALGVDDVRAAFRPANPWEDWLARMVAVTATRAGECPQVERALRDRAMFRAARCWEDDRKLAAENLAAGLARNPARVVARLRATPAGIDWLIARWRLLGRTEPGRWTDGDRTLAAQLLGGDEVLDPTSPGLIDAQLAELEAIRERASEADAVDRELAEAGLLDSAVPELARLRSHERVLHRRLAWCLDQLGTGRAPGASPGATTKPTARIPHPARCPDPVIVAPASPPTEPSGRIAWQTTNPPGADADRPIASFAIQPTGLARPPLLFPGELHELLVAEGLDGPIDLVAHRGRRVDPVRAARRARDARRRRARAGGG